jgi:uncharacterized Zn finger protein (UPF0148 family)
VQGATTFSYQIRALLCDQCGAPLLGTLAGGQVPCRYCGATNVLRVRDDRALFDVARARPMNEQERLARLRMQDGHPMLPPASLAALLPNGQLPPWKVDEAQVFWRATKREVAATSSPEAAERLLFLTMILSNHFAEQNDMARLRAMYESALDVFALPRHRQMMRGYLARNAVREGDLGAAEQWLTPCDPGSDDLQTDSAYRASWALLFTAKGNFQGVLQLLGQRPEDVPILDAMDGLCAILRANAWEKLGQQQVASQQLQQMMTATGPGGRQAMEKFAALYPSLQLCAATLGAAQSAHTVAAARAASTQTMGGIHVVFFPLGVLLLVGAAACLVIVILAQIVDLGPAAAPAAGIALPTLGIMGLVFGGIGYAGRKAAQRAERLRLHGVSGQARVLGVQGTGLEINGVPQVALQLVIEVPGRGPVQTTVKMMMSGAVAQASMPGASVPVRYDATNPSDCILETN